jgi:protein-S-isoprenylcysteine O-methyltransferase Ste14
MDQGWVAPLAVPTLLVWGGLELALRVREGVQGRGGRARDRGTRVLISVAIGVAIAASALAASRAPGLTLPAAVRPVGVAVMWLGLGVRAWAVVTLGAAFRTTVEVDPGQAVVSRGPYRWARHPSYTGLLLLLIGLGLATGNLLSLAATIVLPLPAFIRRIQVEEAELSDVLGEPYRAYQARTARLIPGVW